MTVQVVNLIKNCIDRFILQHKIVEQIIILRDGLVQENCKEEYKEILNSFEIFYRKKFPKINLIYV